jgi:hypothetical protein
MFADFRLLAEAIQHVSALAYDLNENLRESQYREAIISIQKRLKTKGNTEVLLKVFETDLNSP